MSNLISNFLKKNVNEQFLIIYSNNQLNSQHIVHSYIINNKLNCYCEEGNCCFSLNLNNIMICSVEDNQMIIKLQNGEVIIEY